MKVSIIVPVYKVEEYIDKCLKSLVNQTLKDIEVIVINDGSPDNSQKIIDRYAKKYPKIVKSFVKENGGQGSCRNMGLEHAKGEYIAYVDSDDWVELDMYETLYDEAIKNNSDIVVCGNNVVSTDGKILKRELPDIYNNSELNILFGKFAVWNKIYKKEILLDKKIKFREKLWYEDVDFSTKLLFDTHKITYINKCMYNYLLREGSTMNNSNINRNLEILTAFDEIINYFKQTKTYEDVYTKVEFLSIYHIYIAAIVRVINAKANRKNKKIIIKKFIDYINNNFREFKKNNYIKYLDRNKKIIFTLINLRLYFIIKIIFKIKNK